MNYQTARGPENIRLFAIGDVHGRFDLLHAMHRLIAEDLEKRPVADWRVIHLGDYIDRGPQSHSVLDFLINAVESDSRMIALLGNHDEGLLTYLATGDPIGIFGLHGGTETALSYGVEVAFNDPLRASADHKSLLEAIPQQHIDFIANMPRSVSFGDFFFCHAGIDPTVPIDQQKSDDLIWIRNKFLQWSEPFEKFVVHGHTPNGDVDIRQNRVNLDSFAWKSGVLSAIVIDGTEKKIIQATIA